MDSSNVSRFQGLMAPSGGLSGSGMMFTYASPMAAATPPPMEMSSSTSSAPAGYGEVRRFPSSFDLTAPAPLFPSSPNIPGHRLAQTTGGINTAISNVRPGLFTNQKRSPHLALESRRTEVTRRNLTKEERDSLPFVVPNKLQIGILSKDEILSKSVTLINKSYQDVARERKEMNANDEIGKSSTIDSLFGKSLDDPKLGVSSMHGKSSQTACQTCNDHNNEAKNKAEQCPGHLGHILFPQPVIHPLYNQYVRFVLESVCHQCGHMLMSKAEYDSNPDLRKLQGINRLKKIAELSKGKKCIRSSVEKTETQQIIVDNYIATLDEHAMKYYYAIGKSEVDYAMYYHNVIGVKDMIINTIKGYFLNIQHVIQPMIDPNYQYMVNWLSNEIYNEIQFRYQSIDAAACDPKLTVKSLNIEKDTGKVTFILSTEAKLPCYPGLFPWDHDSTNSVEKILNAIPDDQAMRLGLGKRALPKNMICRVWPVIPPFARPACMVHGENKPHALTSWYNDIIELVNRMNRASDKIRRNDGTFVSNKNEYESAYNDFLRAMYHLIYNSGNEYKPGKDHQKWEGLSKSLSGKTAYLRGAAMAKRVEYVARSVLSMRNTLRYGEISIPISYIGELTVRERVTAMNIIMLQRELEQGRIKIFHRNGEKFLASVNAIKINSKILQPGDVVERFLRDGDLVFFNRQPSLHSQSFMAAVVRLTNSITPGIHLSYTTPLNADFDGDEINIHSPQTIGARVEAVMLLNVVKKIIDPKNNRNIMGAVIDAVTGSYLMTKKNPPIPDDLWFQILSSDGLSEYTKYQMQSLQLRWEKYNPGKSMKVGRALFSSILPENFAYDYGSGNDKVFIRNGILISGSITKPHVGVDYYSIVRVIHKNYGDERAGAFINDIYKIVDPWFSTYGQSIGYSDCHIEKVSLEQRYVERHEKRTQEIRAIFITPENKIMRNFLNNSISFTLDDSTKKYIKITGNIPDNLPKEFIDELKNIDKEKLEEFLINRKNQITERINVINRQGELVDLEGFTIILNDSNNDIFSLFTELWTISRFDRTPEDESWMKYYNNTEQLRDLQFRFDSLMGSQEAGDGINGRRWISSVLPSTFNWEGYVTNGILIRPLKYSEIKEFLINLFNQFGMEQLVLILSDIRMMMGYYFGDETKVTSAIEAEIKRAIDKTRLELMSLNEIPKDPDARMFYEKMAMAYLNTSENAGKNLIKEFITEDNAINICISSGAKGNTLNAGQITGTVGFQSASGQFLSPDLTDKSRILPTSLPGDTSLEGRGMVISSFSEGMTPVEQIFHSMGAKFQLIDTAVKTSASGDIYRRISEILKSISVSPDLSLRNITGGIVQPVVYLDGLSPLHLVRVMVKPNMLDSSVSMPAFVNVYNLAATINSLYGVDN